MRVPNVTAKEAVPWHFTGAGDYLQYTWRSVHAADPSSRFQATVVCESGRWSWQVVADPDGSPLTIAAGNGLSREFCEEMATEAVGKAFPSTASHRGLATAASKRYTLANGTRIDLAPGEGHLARATLTDGQVFEGQLSIGGWFIELIEPDGGVVRLAPQQVARIAPA